MDNYGQIKEVQRVLQVKRSGKSCAEIYNVGDVVSVNYKDPLKYPHLDNLSSINSDGCTGRIHKILSDNQENTVLFIDCSTLYRSRIVKVEVKNLIEIKRAHKDDVVCMQEEGERYLCV